MLVNFIKMHSLGNDFVIIDCVTQSFKVNSEIARNIADRKFGIGCDQLLALEPPDFPDHDYKVKIFNSDGSPAKNCGNGLRCVGLFAMDSEITSRYIQKVGVPTGETTIKVFNYSNNVSVSMGIPTIGADITISIKNNKEENNSLVGKVVNLGNKHLIFETPTQDRFFNREVYTTIKHNYKELLDYNISFVSLTDKSNIAIQVFERGVGSTLACGSAATAAAGLFISNQKLDTKVNVHFKYGFLKINWPDIQKNIYLSGPVTRVFSGTFRK